MVKLAKEIEECASVSWLRHGAPPLRCQLSSTFKAEVEHGFSPASVGTVRLFGACGSHSCLGEKKNNRRTYRSNSALCQEVFDLEPSTSYRRKLFSKFV